MSRDKFFFLPDGAPPTFDRDEKLAKLPLPSLEDSLERYYRNLLPFGTRDELANSRKIIDGFKNGIGKKLQKMLEQKAEKERNWVRSGKFTLRVKLQSSFFVSGREILGRCGLSRVEVPFVTLLQHGDAVHNFISRRRGKC
jgi:hypothetical protein